MALPKRVKKSKPTKKIRIKNEQSSCSSCGKKINLRSTTERNVTNLEEKVCLSIQIGYCENEECKNYKVRLRPIDYMNQIVPKSGYGIDVFGLIGELRFEKHQPVGGIALYLQKHHEHIEIKERLLTVKEQCVFFKFKFKCQIQVQNATSSYLFE